MTTPELLNISAAFKSAPLHPVGWGYGQHYSKLASDNYYFKVDDDIMYIQPGAVDAMLFAKLQNRFWVVSANVINHSSKIVGALEPAAMSVSLPCTTGAAVIGLTVDLTSMQPACCMSSLVCILACSACMTSTMQMQHAHCLYAHQPKLHIGSMSRSCCMMATVLYCKSQSTNCSSWYGMRYSNSTVQYNYNIITGVEQQSCA